MTYSNVGHFFFTNNTQPTTYNLKPENYITS